MDDRFLFAFFDRPAQEQEDDYEIKETDRCSADGGPQVAEKLGLTQVTYAEEILNVDEKNVSTQVQSGPSPRNRFAHKNKRNLPLSDCKRP